MDSLNMNSLIFINESIEYFEPALQNNTEIIGDDAASGFGVKLDYLSFSMSVGRSAGMDLPDVVKAMCSAGNYDSDRRLIFSEAGGWQGYTNSAKLLWVQSVGEKSFQQNMGLVAYGGLSQRGRVYVSISGAGCDIVGVAGLTWLTKNFEVLKVNLTRVDIALDDFEGKNTIQSTLRRYKKGEFSNRKAAAKFQYIQKGDNDRSGETIYIGARKSGKLCRIYEKGRQLGDPDSKWLRVEMQFGSHQRKLPVEMLLDPLPYAIGAYPAISKMFRGNVLPCTIRTIRVTSKISVKRVLANMRKNVGPAFNTLLEAGVTPGNLLTILNKVGSNVPKRLLLQGVAESIKLIGLDSLSLKTSPSFYSMGELTAELDLMVSTVSIDDEALCFTNSDILFRRDNVTVTSQDGYGV